LQEIRDWLQRHGHKWPALQAPKRKRLQIAIDKPADQTAAHIVALCGPEKSSEIAQALSFAVSMNHTNQTERQ